MRVIEPQFLLLLCLKSSWTPQRWKIKLQGNTASMLEQVSIFLLSLFSSIPSISIVRQNAQQFIWTSLLYRFRQGDMKAQERVFHILLEVYKDMKPGSTCRFHVRTAIFVSVNNYFIYSFTSSLTHSLTHSLIQINC